MDDIKITEIEDKNYYYKYAYILEIIIIIIEIFLGLTLNIISKEVIILIVLLILKKVSKKNKILIGILSIIFGAIIFFYGTSLDLLTCNLLFVDSIGYIRMVKTGKTNNKIYLIILAIVEIAAICFIVAATLTQIENINDSKKESYSNKLETEIALVKENMYSGEVIDNKDNICSYPKNNNAVVIDLFYKNNKDESLSRLSPFGKRYKDGYVIIYNSGKDDGDYYDYYISLIDEDGNGVAKPIKENKINKSVIKKDKNISDKLIINGKKVRVENTCHLTN